jgi:diacylglycerol kinase
MQKSFKYAINGIHDALKSEPNLRFHFLASIIAIFLAIYLKFTKVELSILVLTIFFVIVSELINTIVEKLVNLNSLEISEEARIIKDISAGVVLFSAIASIIVALFLFLPKLV